MQFINNQNKRNTFLNIYFYFNVILGEEGGKGIKVLTFK